MADVGMVPEPRRPITINLDAGPVVRGHRVVIEELGWYSTADWLFPPPGAPAYLDLTYAFVPPLSKEENDLPVFQWKVWELKVEDDVGTDYTSSTGGVGVAGGDREIHPAPPETAKTLTLSVGTPCVLPDGGLQESTAVARLQVDLESGFVTALEG